MNWTILEKNVQKSKTDFLGHKGQIQIRFFYSGSGSYLAKKSLTCRIRIHSVVNCKIHPIKKKRRYLLMVPVSSNVMMQRNRMCRNLENQKNFRACESCSCAGWKCRIRIIMPLGESRIRMLMRIRIHGLAGRKFEKMYNWNFFVQFFITHCN